MRTIRYSAIIALTVFAVVPTTFAETYPTTATQTSSTGSSDLSVVVPVLYRISGIADEAAGTYSDNTSSVSLQLDQDICVYTNASAGSTYLIRMRGSSTCAGLGCPATPGNTFAISNDNNDQFIPYEVFWNDQTGTTDRTAIGTEGGAQATIGSNQSGASRDHLCSTEGGTNANFSIDFDREDILDVLSGTYTGALEITLLPPV